MNKKENGDAVRRVLIVTSSRLEAESLATGLMLEGFEARGETDPVAALRLLDATRHDLVLIDLMIPQINGLQLSRLIRDRFPGVKTMLMSDYLLSPIQLAKADTGVIGFIPKPCRFDALVAFLKAKLQKTQPEALGEEVTRSTTTTSSSTESSSSFMLPYDIRPAMAVS